MGFTKLDSGIIQSSVMAESPEVFKVWIALLASCRSDGIAPVSPVFIASVCHMNIEEVRKCIEVLSSPDPDSRSIEEEGRRIVRIDGGFRIVNYLKYREFTYSDSAAAKKQKRYRERKKNIVTNGNALHRYVTGLSSASASVSASVSVSDPEKDKEFEEKEKRPEWMDSFDIYKMQAAEAAKELLSDNNWVSERMLYHPGLDIKNTLRKAYQDFWGTEAGWEHKKKQCRKKKGIYPKPDWKRTYQNALTLKCNKVWNQKDTEEEASARFE